jgi:diaminopropionate ammonia-lyase
VSPGLDAERVDADGPAVALIQPRPQDALALPDAASPGAYHATIPGYAPSPLRQAPAAAARLGVARALVKDESSRLGLPSFKVLGASWAVRRALAAHLGAADSELQTFDDLRRAVAGLPLTLSAATDGNHGRALARIASLLGLQCQIYVPDNTVAARIDAIASEGATVTVVDGGYNDAVLRSSRDDGNGCLVISDTSWPGYERVPAWVIEGYATVFDELEAQLTDQGQPRPDAVAIPIGVGALAAAVVRHFWSASALRPRLIGVEPSSAACVLESVAAGDICTLTHPQDSIMAGLNCATPSLIAWPLVSRGLDAYVAVGDDHVGEAMALLAQDGIVAGETGAAGLVGMMALSSEPQAAVVKRELGIGPDSTVLLLCTEGATDPDGYERLLTQARAASETAQ